MERQTAPELYVASTKDHQALLRQFSTSSTPALAELVGELYLAEGKKKEKVWQTTGEVMTKLGVPAARLNT